MTGKEVIEILGKPSHISDSDGESSYWCYETNSIAHTFEGQPEIECGNLILQTRYKGNRKELEAILVTKIYDFK